MTVSTWRLGVTPIGLGCMQFAGRGIVARTFYPPLDQQTVTDIVAAARSGGINWFDTAEMYGGGMSERLLTSALRERGVAPGEVVIATKWAPLMRTASSITRTLPARLDALQGYPIGLHQIHMPAGALSPLAGQVRAMGALCRDRRITAVGVSNFSAGQMRMAARVLAGYGVALAANQVEISLVTRRVDRNGVLATARELGVTLIAYSPLRSGLLTGRFHDDPSAVPGLRVLRRRLGGFGPRLLERTAPLVTEVQAVAKAHGATAAQVALAWLTTFYGDTVVAIPGASKPRHAEESAAAMHLRLSERELSRLDELSR